MAERRFPARRDRRLFPRPRPQRAGAGLASDSSADLSIVSSDEKVFDFPKAEITSEEKVRRAMAEAARTALHVAPPSGFLGVKQDGAWNASRTAERSAVRAVTRQGLMRIDSHHLDETQGRASW